MYRRLARRAHVYAYTCMDECMCVGMSAGMNVALHVYACTCDIVWACIHTIMGWLQLVRSINV